MAKCEIIAIGSELLLGDIVNSNAAWLSAELAAIGISVHYHTTVGDNMERIEEALSTAVGRADIVITTGGLGPTDDDITHEAVARFAGRDYAFNQKAQDHLDNFFRSLGRTPARSNSRQTYLPGGAEVVSNPIGTAVGIMLDYKDSRIITFPGVPAEMKGMFDATIRDYLKTNHQDGVIISRTIKLYGLPEADMGEQVSDLMAGSNPTVGILAGQGIIKLRITAKAADAKKCRKLIAPVEKTIHKRLGQYVWGYDEDTPESVIAAMLLKHKKTLAIAESCTGGMVSARIVNVSGASRFYKGGIVAYSNEVKENQLSVPSEIIRNDGAVSEDTAKAMALGLIYSMEVDFAISVTGVAGPDGGTEAKPVGMVCFAMAYSADDGLHLDSFTRHIGQHFTREIIRERAVSAALLRLREFIYEFLEK